jgi:hypothetical protein
MSITSAKTGSTGLSLALDNNYMEPIASVLLGSSSAVTIFNDIPQTYKHLQLRLHLRTSTASNTESFFMNFNGDIAANYTTHRLWGDGGNASASGDANVNSMQVDRIAGASATANVYGAVIVDILDYANTNKFKTARWIGGTDGNGSGYIMFSSGLWMSKNPITSILIDANGANNFIQYSRFSLYGIKG